MKALTLITAAAAVLTAAHRTEFSNGSFSQGKLEPWKKTQGAAITRAFNTGPSADPWCMMFRGGANAEISQTFDVDPGRRYAVTYEIACLGPEEGSCRLRLRVFGNTETYAQDATGKPNAEGVRWQKWRMDFVADWKEATIHFQDLSTNQFITLLDNVRVSEVIKQ